MLKNCEKTIRAIRKELANYIRENNIKSLIIGISGGVDSALCCALASPVCRNLDLPFIGRSITIETNTREEIERAKSIGRAFCSDFKLVDLTKAYLEFYPSVMEDFNSAFENVEYKIRKGNIKARIRMIYLYDLANKHRGMVLSTDNRTEFLLGFWTLHGDVGDFGMIQNLWKTEVYMLARHIARNLKDEAAKAALISCIEAPPTDGLGITKTDLDQIKADTYYEVDKILISYQNSDKSLENHPVIKRHLKTEFKRKNPYNIEREKIVFDE